MSGYTKPDLKRFAKSDNLVIKFLANEVLTLRELAGEARKDARRVVEEIVSLQKQVETARVEGIQKCIDIIKSGDYVDGRYCENHGDTMEMLADKLQALKGDG